MKKKTIGLALAGAISLGLVGGVPSLAAEQPVVTKDGQNMMNSHAKFRQHDDFLQKKAEELGISTDDKDFRTLAQEIREAQLKKEANEFGISTDGKDFRTLAQEIREAQLKKEANELGITIDGKDLFELAKEVHEAKVLNAAKKLAINTTDKTTAQLMQEIMTNYADQLDELGLTPAIKAGHHGNFGFGDQFKGKGHFENHLGGEKPFEGRSNGTGSEQNTIKDTANDL